MKRRSFEKLKFDHLGIDEMSFKKGHKYITVLSNSRFRCVLEVEEDRNKKSCKKTLNKSFTIEKNKMSIQ